MRGSNWPGAMYCTELDIANIDRSNIIRIRLMECDEVGVQLFERKGKRVLDAQSLFMQRLNPFLERKSCSFHLMNCAPFSSFNNQTCGLVWFGAICQQQ